MAIPDVNRNKIEEAFKYYDENLRDTEEWKNFMERKNHKYAIKYSDKLYPVKKIINIATGAHVSTFSGGDEANNYIKDKDFEIIDLDEIKNQPLKSNLKKVLDNYLHARNNDNFTGHDLGNLVRHTLPEVVSEYLSRFNFEQGQYEIKGSIGQGNWARVPWLAILDKEITTTTQEGVYVVYLFSSD